MRRRAAMALSLAIGGALGVFGAWAVPVGQQPLGVADLSNYWTIANVQAAITALAPVKSVNGQTGDIVTATLPGLYALSGGTPLPDPAANIKRYAYLSDMGGGPGYVYSTGSCWKRLALSASPQTIPVTSAVNLVALLNSSTVILSGSNFSAASTVNVTNACPGDVFTLAVPNNVISTLGGSLGISINSSAVLQLPGITGGTWGDFVFDGTRVVKIRGGTL